VFYINIYEIINSIDSTLEKNVKSYDNSFADNFIDALKSHLEENNTTKNTKTILNNTLLTLDRFEGNFAICEDRQTKKMHNIPTSMINSSAKEGDLLVLQNNKYQTVSSETKKQFDIIQEKFNKNCN